MGGEGGSAESFGEGQGGGCHERSSGGLKEAVRAVGAVGKHRAGVAGGRRISSRREGGGWEPERKKMRMSKCDGGKGDILRVARAIKERASRESELQGAGGERGGLGLSERERELGGQEDRASAMEGERVRGEREREHDRIAKMTSEEVGEFVRAIDGLGEYAGRLVEELNLYATRLYAAN